MKTTGLELYYEAEKLLSFIRRDELKNFSKALYDAWDKRGAYTSILILLNKYYDDDTITDELFNLLEKNISDNNTQMIKSFTSAVLLVGGKLGFRKIAKLLSTKKNYDISNVFYEIGDKLKIARGFLDDLSLNSFGFDSNGNKIIDYVTRKFTLTMTPDFKFTVLGDNGKSYKNLPKPSKKDDQVVGNKAYEDFKNMKKELKDFVKMQKNRLEKEMINNTLRDIDDWEYFLFENPIMNNLAKGLIWSVDGNTFRIMDDNTFADIEDEDFKLPESGKISLIHPIELSKEEIEAWKEQLNDYEITQPITQLERFVFTPTDEQLDLTLIDDFQGHMVMRISFKSKMMDKYAWSRGPAEDAGCYYSYDKYLNLGIKAEMQFMGECYGGYGDRFQEIWIGELAFYNTAGKEMQLKDIPKRLLSEVYLEVKALADSGSGYNKDYLDTVW